MFRCCFEANAPLAEKGAPASSKVCAVAKHFTCLMIEPSGRWVRSLVLKYEAMKLYVPDYHIVLDDGTLNVSRVTGLKEEGILYDSDSRAPLFAAELAAKRRGERAARVSPQLFSGDPLAVGGARRNARGRGRGRPQRGARGKGLARTPPARSRDRNAAGHGNGDGEVAAEEAEPEDSRGDGGNHSARDALDEVASQESEGCGLSDELEGLLEEDAEELVANFAGPALAGTVAPFAEDVAREGDGEHLAPGLEAAIAEDAEEIGLAENPAVEEGTAAEVGHAASSSSDIVSPPPAPLDLADAEQPSLRERHGIVGPSPLGYLSMGGRCFLRIQRGNPKSSLSVRCYKHPQCSFLLPLRVAPSDEELIQWSFEVAASEPGAPAAEARALAAEHLRLASKWRPPPRQKAKAKAAE